MIKRLSHSFFRWVEFLDAQPLRLPVCVIGLAFAYNVLIAAIYEIPVPRVHDEFAYLLTGDTFASGRITNPTHPMHAFFETFHVFQEPTYQAKYPPGQGAFLALGQVICGQPIAGVWLSMALACGALYWMFRARFSAIWSLIGAFFPLLGHLLYWQWAHTYWGGGVALIGGALLFGGVLRAGQRTFSVAFAIAASLVLLAVTRPAEGLLTAGLLLTASAITEFRRGTHPFFIRFGMMIFIGGTLAIGITLYYNHTLTGDAFTFPHSHWNNTVLNPDAPRVMQEYTGSKIRTPVEELIRLKRYFIGPLALVLILFFFRPVLAHKVEALLVLFVIIVVTTFSIVTTAAHPHYLAPVLPLVYFLVLLGLYRLHEVSPVGRWCSIAIVVIFVGFNGFLTAQKIVRRPIWDWANERQMIARQLATTEGKHLVLVRYAPEHSSHHEYVYNAAQIDAAPVVWARFSDKADMRPLLEYFHDRTVWLLDADRRPNSVVPYPITEEQ